MPLYKSRWWSKICSSSACRSLDDYRTALGGFLGPKLYEAIADVLDENELEMLLPRWARAFAAC